MSTLWLAVEGADAAVRQRAVDALHDAGVEVSHAGPRPDTVVLSRDPVGIVLASGLAVLFGGAAGWLLVEGGWWIALGVLCAVVAVLWLAGLASAVQLKNRTEKGPRETPGEQVL